MKSSARGQFRRLLLGSIFLPLIGVAAQARQTDPQPVSKPAQQFHIYTALQNQQPNGQPNTQQNDQTKNQQNKQNQPIKPNKPNEPAVAGRAAIVDLDLDGKIDVQTINQAGGGAVFYLRTPVENLLGANMAPPDGAVRAQLGIPADRGLVVTSIVNEGPAAKVGLVANDIILMVADKPVANMGDIAEALKAAPEKVVGLKLLRAGKEVAISVRSVPRVTWAPATEKAVNFYIGVSAAPIEETLQVHLGLPKNQGLLAKEIVAESPAEKCGLKAHDILIEVNGISLDQADTLQKTVQESHGQPVKLKLIRAGKPLNIQVTPEGRASETDAASATTLMLLGRGDSGTVWQNTEKGYWAELTRGATNGNAGPYTVQTHPEAFKGIHFLPFVETVYDPRLAAAHGSSTTAQPDPTQTLTARIDRLESEIKAIKTAVESIRDALKK